MNIIFVTNNLNQIGGVERVISKLSDYFVEELNYNVTILSIYSKEIRSFFKINNKVNIVNLGIEIENGLPMIYKMKKNKYLKKQIFNYISNQRYDVIFTLHSFISKYILSNRRNLKGKVIATEHVNHKFYSKKRTLVNIFTFRKANKLVVLTQDEKQFYSKYMKNVVVIPNTKPFNSKIISKKDQKRIISVGRLEDVKGFDYLIKSFNIASKDNDEWELNIIGDGGKKEELKRLIHDLKLENKVKILPFTNNIKEEYLKSSIYAFSSRCESFGLVLLEAMECGLPIVSFDIPCAREILSDENDSLLAKSFYVQDFAEKLMILMNDSDKRDVYGENAKKNVQRFNMNVIGQKWKKLIFSLQD